MSMQVRLSQNEKKRPEVTQSSSIAAAAERLRRRQRSLIDQYKHVPETALVRDHASTSAEHGLDDGPLDAAHGWVKVGRAHSVTLPVAVHPAVGGMTDYPVPGDILCAALASCTDSTIRLIANAGHIDLQVLRVDVTGEVDVRGALFVSPNVPVRFQRFHVKVFVRSAPGTATERLERFLSTAEHSCVVMQTLRAAVPVTVEYDAASMGATG